MHKKKYLRSISGLVWLKLCWGKDIDHEKMDNFGNTKQTSMLDAAKQRRGKIKCNQRKMEGLV